MPPISSRLTIMNGITMRDRTATSTPSNLDAASLMPVSFVAVLDNPRWNRPAYDCQNGNGSSRVLRAIIHGR